MFLKLRLKTQGAVAIATTIAAVASGGCSDTTAGTDLRPEGPPDVLAVLVLNDSINGLIEHPTYCKHGDEKRPALVGLPDFTTTQLCPTDPNEDPPIADDASPDTFYVRIMFDELLNPGIETLDPILDDNGLETGSFTGSLRDSQPVTLKCKGVDGMMHDLAYDGYYSPSGNAVTWPVGPSLVIKPAHNVVVPTNSDCEIAIKPGIVFDKQGNEPDNLGPFKFKVSAIKSIIADPGDDVTLDATIATLGGITLVTNAAVDPTSVCDEGTTMDQCEGKFTPDDPNTVDGTIDYGNDGSAALFYGPGNAFETDKEYTFEITGGTIKDFCGAVTTLKPGTVEDNTKFTFKTNPFKFNTISHVANDNAPAIRKPQVTFSNLVDLTSVTAAELSVTPAPASLAIANTANFDGARLAGFYQPNTEYTFTFAAGATVDDIFGVTATNMMAREVKFKTQPIALTASAPANGATVTKATPTSATQITFTFNQNMDAATFDAADVELTGATTALAFGASSGCASPAGTSCTLVVQGTFVPGEYTLKLKKDAVIKDMLGNDYVQAADRSIKFTVKEAPASPPAPPCLGS
jgi:hypothetical protein